MPHKGGYMFLRTFVWEEFKNFCAKVLKLNMVFASAKVFKQMLSYCWLGSVIHATPIKYIGNVQATFGPK